MHMRTQLHALRKACQRSLLLLQQQYTAAGVLHRPFASNDADALKICVVGSGPAGLYATDELLKTYGEGVHVDVVDRLPTPFGLVRSGVSPDHQDTKNVTHRLSSVCASPHASFIGNVDVGRDVSLSELRRLYNAVVLAYGAESDRRLNIPGEDSAGVISAREFVWWFNAHPDAKNLAVDLSKVRSVAICGIGNVALDCARVLLQPPASLEPTDIAEHAMQQLRSSSVTDVHLFARRGPVQAACTPKELKEVTGLSDVACLAAPKQLAVSAEDQAQMKAVRLKRRVHEIIKNATAQPSPNAPKRLHFQLYRNPVEIMADESGHVCAVRVEETVLAPDPSGSGAVVAMGTGRFEVHEAQLVLKSIGYRSLPLEGLPFDARSGTVPHVAGRVLAAGTVTNVEGPASASTRFEPGLYVCGWLKRGPTGVIGTNIVDAAETVQSIVADTSQLPRVQAEVPGAAGLRQLLQARGVQPVEWAGWLKLDAEEQRRGAAAGKVRDKLLDVNEMLKVANK